MKFGRLRRGLVRLRKPLRRLTVARHSFYGNIYHCCTQKTASQWFRAVLSDPIVYKYTGLDTYLFPQWRKELLYQCFDDTLSLLDVSASLYAGYLVSVPLPKRTIGLDLYIGYQTCAAIPKPTNYRTFFILRDPRDIVVSWYFSTLHSHAPTTEFLIQCRNDLKELDIREGLKYSIDRVQEFGLFVGQRSWVESSVKDDENSQVFRYEDFARDNFGFLKELFVYLDIQVPDDELGTLFQRHKFETYSAGRSKGSEDAKSHYRKGVAGDWQNYFDTSLLSYFQQRTGDLLKVLGYS